MPIKSGVTQTRRFSEALNLIYLACIQGGNALIPLLIFPYLLSQLGTETFAKLATLEAASFIILIISLYSFDVRGLKLIDKSSRRGGRSLTRTYYSILYARLFLFFTCFPILAITVFMLDSQMTVASFIWLLFPLGVVLQSSYFYQATSNNFPLALFVLAPRILACALTILYANENTSLSSASSFISFSYLTSGVASALYLRTRLGFISPMRIKRHALIMLHQGKYLFIGSISVILYRGINVLLLTALNSSPLAISTYAIAEKYIKMLQAVILPATQIFSVRLVRAIVNRKNDANSIHKILWENTKPQIILGALLTAIFLAIFTTASANITWLMSKQSIALIVIMTPATIFGIVNHMYGTIAYSSLNLDGIYAKILFFCGITSTIISSISIILLEDIGAAYAFTLAEVILTAVFIYFIKRIALK